MAKEKASLSKGDMNAVVSAFPSVAMAIDNEGSIYKFMNEVFFALPEKRKREALCAFAVALVIDAGLSGDELNKIVAMVQRARAG